MERFKFGYSLKNIPIPSERNYKMMLMEKIELVIKKMRWKVIYSNEDQRGNENNERIQYGLKSPYCPPVVKDLTAFETDLCNLVTKIKFRRVNCSFQHQLKKDAKNISTSNQIYTPADKTSNIYKISKDQYSHLLKNAVTSTYKKTTTLNSAKINEDGKGFAQTKVS